MNITAPVKIIILFLLVTLSFSGQTTGQSLKGLKVYINPGHGGYDDNDRNVPLPLFGASDTAGFWESKSNLVKGLHLRKLLEAEGAQVFMSRVQNRTVDDRSLSAIAEEANANQADFMISVHSNAFNGVTNYVLQLFHGYDNNPILQQSMDMANLFWGNLFSNQVPHWTYQKPNVRGDKSFAPASWNGYGVLRPLMVPGLISEGSFHDYIPETYRLMNDDYKKLEAWHFFSAFCRYYGGNPGKKGQIAGFVKDSSKLVTGYNYVPGSKDRWLPVNSAKVTLLPGNTHYLTDPLNNGFFIFDNLPEGKYRLKFEVENYPQFITDTIRVDSAKVSYYLCYINGHPTGIQDHNRQIKPDISIYPNPAENIIHINLSTGNGSCRYQIANHSGQIVMEGYSGFTGGDGLINIGNLSPGLYVLRLFPGNGPVSCRFVKI